MSTLIIVANIIYYLIIGYLWGRWSWSAWAKKKRSFAALFCFPFSYWHNTIGEDSKPNSPFIAGFFPNHPDGYLLLSTVGFPAKALFNTAVLAAFSVIYPVFATVDLLIKAWPKISAFLLPKKQPLPTKPDPNQFDIHEYQDLLAQRDRIDARIKILEAHPDKKKIIALPRRP